MLPSLFAALALNLLPAFATPGDAGLADAGLAMVGAPQPEALEAPTAPADTPQPEARPKVEIVALQVGTAVSRRVLVDPQPHVSVEAERVYAHLTVRNPGPETALRMVWRRDGKRVQDLTVDVGRSPRWRTWSYKRLRLADVGDWTVEVIDAEGAVIGRAAFTVYEPGC